MVETEDTLQEFSLVKRFPREVEFLTLLVVVEDMD